MSKNKIYLSKEVEFDDEILSIVIDAIDKTMSYLLEEGKKGLEAFDMDD